MAKKKESAANPAIVQKPSCENSRLVFPGLCVVIIQTFTLDSSFIFKLGPNTSGLIHRFNLNEELNENLWFDENPKPFPFSENYELKGFDFHFTSQGDYYIPDSDFDLQGHCAVKMDVLFGKTISVTYRFNFNQKVCKTHKSFTTDRTIDFIKCFLSSEHRSAQNPSDSDDDKGGAFFESAHIVFPFSEDGLPLSTQSGTSKSEISLNGNSCRAKAGTEILHRYKSFIIRCCTGFRNGISRSNGKLAIETAINSLDEEVYAYVDIPHTLMHLDSQNEDLFSNKRDAALNNKEIIDHIKRYHRRELINLLSLTPEHWGEKNEELFDSVCGNDITMDTDDLVFIGDRVGVCFGLYYRGQSIWDDFLPEINEYDGITWPECMMMLQFYLAQRTVIRHATKILLRNAVSQGDSLNLTSIISRNQDINFYLAQSMLQYEAVQYRQTFYARMAEDIAKRLKIKSIKAQFEHHMNTIDNSLRNIKDSQSSSRETRMNIILGIVSVISAFQLFFVGTKMPFLSEYWHIESGVIGAILITIVAVVAVIVILVFLYSALKSVPRRKK